MSQYQDSLAQPKRIVAFGEVLWDILPDGPRLGGAPLNFAVRAHELGNDVCLVSSVGTDELGDNAISQIERLGLSVEFITRNPEKPTGTVTVEFDNGQPKYEIHRDVAYDYIYADDKIKAAAKSADCFYFGTLIQRSISSRIALQTLVQSLPKSATRFVDLNLRRNCYDSDNIWWSVKNSDIIKMSSDELEEVGLILGQETYINSAQDIAKAIVKRGVGQTCIVSQGGDGAIAASSKSGALDFERVHGSVVPIFDTVGAGDAFCAGFVHNWLQQKPLKDCLELGNAMGALAVSKPGGTTPFRKTEIDDLLAKKWH
jgi:fructokinase